MTRTKTTAGGDTSTKASEKSKVPGASKSNIDKTTSSSNKEKIEKQRRKVEQAKQLGIGSADDTTPIVIPTTQKKRKGTPLSRKDNMESYMRRVLKEALDKPNLSLTAGSKAVLDNYARMICEKLATGSHSLAIASGKKTISDSMMRSAMVQIFSPDLDIIRQLDDAAKTAYNKYQASQA